MRAPIQKKWIYYIEERRREVAQMLAQGHSETEIAHILGVHASTICRDVKVLKQLSQRFVFDLAKGDLAYYYEQCIEGVDEIRKETWNLYKYRIYDGNGTPIPIKDKVSLLKLLKECDEARFALLEKSPSGSGAESRALKVEISPAVVIKDENADASAEAAKAAALNADAKEASKAVDACVQQSGRSQPFKCND